jgi:H+/Cl- antiporter ClcA
MKKLFEPVVGMTSAIVAKAENAHEIIINQTPDFSPDTLMFYLMIGFLGAFGGWMFRMLVKCIKIKWDKHVLKTSRKTNNDNP